MELPQYRITQAATRVALPQALLALLLTPLVIIGIYLNFKALRIDFPDWLGFLVFIAGIVFSVLEYLLYYKRALATEYLFYLDRIEVTGKKPEVFYLRDYSVGVIKKNLFDILLKTGSIKLSTQFTLGPVPSVVEVNNYIVNLANYTRRRV